MIAEERKVWSMLSVDHAVVCWCCWDLLIEWGSHSTMSVVSALAFIYYLYTLFTLLCTLLLFCNFWLDAKLHFVVSVLVLILVVHPFQWSSSVSPPYLWQRSPLPLCWLSSTTSLRFAWTPSRWSAWNGGWFPGRPMTSVSCVSVYLHSTFITDLFWFHTGFIWE